MRRVRRSRWRPCPTTPASARAKAARRKIGDCDARLAKYRAVLDAGGDALTVASWMAEVKGERLAAERELGAAGPAAEPLTRTQVRTLVEGLKDVLSALADADPTLKAEAYAELGIRIEYDPHNNRATVVAQPSSCTQVRVGGASAPMNTRPALRVELDLRIRDS